MKRLFVLLLACSALLFAPLHARAQSSQFVLIGDLGCSLYNNGTAAVENQKSTASFSPYTGYAAIPAYVYYKDRSYIVNTISAGAFWGSKITGVTIPSTVEQIQYWAFRRCENINSITIPSSVKEIGAYCFAESNFKTVKFESTDKHNLTIGTSLFSGCTELENIILPNKLTIIEDNMFCKCASLKDIQIPNSVTKIGVYAFSICYSLEAIQIPSSVTELGAECFSNCINLKSIEIPNSITKLPNSMCKNCEKLETVIIPESVTSFEEGYLFHNCKNLKHFYLNQPNAAAITSFGYNSLYNVPLPYATLYVPEGCANDYRKKND